MTHLHDVTSPASHEQALTQALDHLACGLDMLRLALTGPSITACADGSPCGRCAGCSRRSGHRGSDPSGGAP